MRFPFTIPPMIWPIGPLSEPNYPKQPNRVWYKKIKCLQAWIFFIYLQYRSGTVHFRAKLKKLNSKSKKLKVIHCSHQQAISICCGYDEPWVEIELFCSLWQIWLTCSPPPTYNIFLKFTWFSLIESCSISDGITSQKSYLTKVFSACRLKNKCNLRGVVHRHWK